MILWVQILATKKEVGQSSLWGILEEYQYYSWESHSHNPNTSQRFCFQTSSCLASSTRFNMNLEGIQTLSLHNVFWNHLIGKWVSSIESWSLMFLCCVSLHSSLQYRWSKGLESRHHCFFVSGIKSNQSFHIKCIVTPGLFVGILNYVKELPFYFNFAEDFFQKWMSNYAKWFFVSLEIICILSLYLFRWITLTDLEHGTTYILLEWTPFDYFCSPYKLSVRLMSTLSNLLGKY